MRSRCYGGESSLATPSPRPVPLRPAACPASPRGLMYFAPRPVPLCLAARSTSPRGPIYSPRVLSHSAPRPNLLRPASCPTLPRGPIYFAPRPVPLYPAAQSTSPRVLSHSAPPAARPTLSRGPFHLAPRPAPARCGFPPRDREPLPIACSEKCRKRIDAGVTTKNRPICLASRLPGEKCRWKRYESEVRLPKSNAENLPKERQRGLFSK